MPSATLKPTFITLGHIRVRRKLFAGIVDENKGIAVMIGKESPYKEYVNDPEKAEEVLEDFRKLKEKSML